MITEVVLPALNAGAVSRNAEDDEPAAGVVRRRADERIVVVDDERQRVDAGLQVGCLTDDQRPPGRDARGQETYGGRRDVVDPRVQQVLAVLGLVRELIGTRVDRDVEASAAAGTARRQRRHRSSSRRSASSRRSGSRRSPARRFRPSSRARTDRSPRRTTRPSTETPKLTIASIDVDRVEMLGAVLVHRRAGVVRRRPERLGRAAVDRDVARAGRRCRRSGASSARSPATFASAGRLDEERVRHAALRRRSAQAR